MLRQITMNDLPVGRSVDETLRLVQAFQYTDKHGEGPAPLRSTPSTEHSITLLYSNYYITSDDFSLFNFVILCLAVCPAGWKPGSDTVRACVKRGYG